MLPFGGSFLLTLDSLFSVVLLSYHPTSWVFFLSSIHWKIPHEKSTSLHSAVFSTRIVNPVSLSFISSSGRLNLLLVCFGSLVLFPLVNYSYFYTSLIAWRICRSIYGYSYSYFYFFSSIFFFFCWDVEVNLTFGWKLKIDEVKERSKFRPSAYSEFSIDNLVCRDTLRLTSRDAALQPSGNLQNLHGPVPRANRGHVKLYLLDCPRRG